MNRIKKSLCACLVFAAVAVAPSVVQAQPAQSAASKPTLETVAVQVEVALTRWQGEKKTSSLPFILISTAAPRGTSGNNSTSIRMGVDVPVGTSTSNSTQTTGAQGNSPRAVETTKSEMTFRNVGTDIDTQVVRADETTFTVYVNIRDSAIFSADSSKPPTAITDPTAFRTFNTSNTLPMKDGQTRLFGLATDKITGETMRIEVKLTVLK
jgi:hypothetical protein